MRRSTMPPARLLFGVTFLPEDFPQRLERFKEASGLTWDGLAACLGIDPRQLQRWRKGTKPSGDGLFALIMLAARIPGGVHTLLGTGRRSRPSGTRRKAAPGDGPGLDQPPDSIGSPPCGAGSEATSPAARYKCNPNTGGTDYMELTESGQAVGYGGPSRRTFPRGWNGSRSCRASRGGEWRGRSE